MNIEFIKADPAQNMTIFVKSNHDRSLYKEISERLMKYNSVYAEQVGFIESPGNQAAWARLQMMGGEFCGNAALSLAAVIARDKGLKNGETMTIPLEVSGVNGILNCEVVMNDQVYICKIEMPAPVIEADMVRFPGITHRIIDAREVAPENNSYIEETIKSLLAADENEAFGLMFFDEAKQFMTPVVYVKDIGSIVRERSCASGTAALGAFMSSNKCGDIEFAVNQPGGSITVIVKGSAHSFRIWIKTEVRIAAEGTAFI